MSPLVGSGGALPLLPPGPRRASRPTCSPFLCFRARPRLPARGVAPGSAEGGPGGNLDPEEGTSAGVERRRGRRNRTPGGAERCARYYSGAGRRMPEGVGARVARPEGGAAPPFK